MGKLEGPSGGRGSREWEERWARAFLVASAGKNGPGGSEGLGLASFNNCSKLWGLRAVLGCLIPGPG